MTFYECSGLYKKMFMDQVLAVNPNAKWIWFDNIQGPESADNETLDVSDVAGRWVISKEVEEDKEKRDRILDLLNYVVSKEGLNLVSYGIEGRHYNIENEKIVPTEQMSKECDFYCQTKFPEAKDAFASAHEADRYEIYDEAVDIPDGLHKSDMDKYITDNMIKFVYGERPVDEYDNFIQELKDSFQFDEYMEAAKSQMKEKGYIK
jgi:putative aldouronate transport system substrate-binding protein